MHKFFIENWLRKITALLVAMLIWFVVQQMITTSKTFADVFIRVINIPTGLAVRGLGNDGLLSKQISLHITGSKNVLDYISSAQLEVILDAENKPQNWQVQITKNELVLTGAPEEMLKKNITRISHPKFELQFVPKG